MRRALIVGVQGPALTPEETFFLRVSRPVGLILFARNLVSHDQIRTLVADVRAAVGDNDLLVLIDQEGGRVQRLRPPLGRVLPAADAYARLYASDPAGACRRAFLAARLVAADLRALGINVNCTPVLDLPAADGHAVIGDRAYGRDVEQIAALGRAVAEGFIAGGVVPVIKHIPGHGRATKDSHFDLPVVAAPRAELAATDFAPFRALRDMPAAMTAHVVFTAIDPAAPASTSRVVTEEIIRGDIGFDGLLMSDDLSMKALAGSFRARAEAVVAAGSDVVLHCNGDLAEMHASAEGTPELAGSAARRLAVATAIVTAVPGGFDVAEAEAGLSEALGARLRAPESV